MKLFIDTSNNRRTIVKLGNKRVVKTYPTPRSQRLLSIINELLKQENKTLKDVSSIKVNPGPGSFTSLRIGITVANTLGFALNIPVNSKNPGTPIEPQYGRPPNITQPKKKFTT